MTARARPGRYLLWRERRLYEAITDPKRGRLGELLPFAAQGRNGVGEEGEQPSIGGQLLRPRSIRTLGINTV